MRNQRGWMVGWCALVEQYRIAILDCVTAARFRFSAYLSTRKSDHITIACRWTLIGMENIHLQWEAAMAIGSLATLDRNIRKGDKPIRSLHRPSSAAALVQQIAMIVAHHE